MILMGGFVLLNVFFLYPIIIPIIGGVIETISHYFCRDTLER